MYDTKKLLSICIPTHNRAKILDNALKAIQKELKTIDCSEIEFIVSDNCSPDNTEEVVLNYIQTGMPIIYSKNTTNLGMDGNFVQCFKKATAQYVWVLGDDDFLKDGALSFLLAKLKNTDYGLIHLKIFPKEKDEETKIYQTIEEYLSDISYWITFISSNIVATKFVPTINFEKYMGTWFTLIPLYITAAKESQKNLMINKRIFEDAADGATNGGYNFFEVFVVNYLTIRREMLVDTKNEMYYYKKEKKRLFNEFLLGFIYKFYFKKNKGKFKTEGGWRILFQYFGGNIYFYKGILKLTIKRLLPPQIIQRIKKMLS